MAHTKSGGSTKLGRESRSKRLGVKLYDGEKAAPGEILIRQRGTSVLAGRNVRRGGDDTLYAALAGTVKFSTKLKTGFDGKKRTAKVMNIVPLKAAVKA
jgi:large subunit ribosomal protein L27